MRVRLAYILPALFVVFVMGLSFPAKSDFITQTCFDGQDNDGDGVADANDADCREGNFFEARTQDIQNGLFNDWIVFTPSADTRKIYVSATGNDSNNGLSPTSPKRTLAAGYSLLRHGYPDWLLLKRGDTFRESFQTWRKAGRNANEPLVVASYGLIGQANPLLISSTPIIQTTNGGGNIHLNDIVFGDLNFYNAARDPNSPEFVPGPNGGGVPGGHKAVSWMAHPSERVTFQGIKFSYWFDAAIFSGNDSAPDIADFEIRNSVITHSYGVHTTTMEKSSGIYFTGTNGLRLVNNFFFHNGWLEQLNNTYDNIYNHNIYGAAHNAPTTHIGNNVIAYGSSHGVQLRGGGNVIGNLFYTNAIHLLMGIQGTVERNVILNSRNINGAPGSTPQARGTGIDIQQIRQDGTGLYVRNNTLVNTTSGTNHYGIHVDGRDCAGNQTPLTPECPVYKTVIASNLIQWKNPLTLDGELAFPNNQINRLGIKRNFLKSTEPDGPVISIRSPVFNPGTVLFTTNAYYHPQNAPTFYVNGQIVNFAQWQVITNDLHSNTTNQSIIPTRTLASYAVSLGLQGTDTALFTEIGRQEKGNWRPEYTAQAINAYINGH